MRKSGFGAVATTAAAAALLLMTPQAQGAVVNVGSATGAPGDTVVVGVSLDTEGADVAGTQNDIGFQPETVVVAKQGKCSETKTTLCLVDGDCPEGETCKGVAPDCAVNEDIDKGGTSFAFQPPGCQAEACTGIRALVLSLSNVDPISDGSELYTCQVAIASDAPAGDYALVNTNVGASDPDGLALEATGTDGAVTVEGGPADATILIGSAEGLPGEVVSVDVSLETGVDVAGTQNDISFDPMAAIVAKQGKCSETKTTLCLVDGDCPEGETCKGVAPDCAVNEDIDKGGTSFAFQPPGCQAEACTGIRALVLSLSNVDPIPDGSVMYTCQVAIAEDADTDTTYPLTCSNAGASDPDGLALTTDCTDGGVTVPGGEPPTPTPTETEIIPPTTPPTVPPTSPPGEECDDDGCQLVAPADSHAGWILLLPAAALLWLRRRSR